MKQYFGFLLMMMVFNTACATTAKTEQARAVASESDVSTSEAKLISLEKYDSGIAIFRVGVCPEDAKINVDVKFSPSGNPSLVYADLSFRVPNQQCLANTSQLVTVDVQAKIKEAALQKGVKASYILMKSIPNRIEVDQL